MMQMEEEEEYGSSNDYYVQSPSSSFSHPYHHHTVTVTKPQQILLLPLPYQAQQEDEEDECNYPTKPLLNLDHNMHGASSVNKVGVGVGVGAIPPSYPIMISSNNNHNLSRCSSSRASTTSLVHHNNNNVLLQPAADHHDANNNNNNAAVLLSCSNSAAAAGNTNNIINKLAPVSIIKMGKLVDDDDDDELYIDDKAGNCWKYLSFETYPSFIWIALQLLWRFILSAMLALLVFYLVTRPPPPHFSLKVIGVKQFEVTQGVDLTGVATNYLSCNISMGLIIDNRSKVFGLHTTPPLVHIYFARVPFVMSQGEEMYVKSREWREIWLSAGTNKKAMYGGGTTMEDMLYSGTGLPLSVTLEFKSYITVLPKLIHSHFHHQAHCLLLLRSFTDHKPHSSLFQSLNTTCNFLTTS